MLRNTAIALLNEITGKYPDLLARTTQISLQMEHGDTRMMIKSRFDFDQKTALLRILKDKGLKVIDSSRDHESLWIIY